MANKILLEQHACRKQLSHADNIQKKLLEAQGERPTVWGATPGNDTALQALIPSHWGGVPHTEWGARAPRGWWEDPALCQLDSRTRGNCDLW